MKLNKEQILSIIRQILTAAGVIMITTGVMETGIYTEIIGSIMTLISTIWSIVDKTDASMAQKMVDYQAKQKK